MLWRHGGHQVALQKRCFRKTRKNGKNLPKLHHDGMLAFALGQINMLALDIYHNG
jgi:hypothetical protein